MLSIIKAELEDCAICTVCRRANMPSPKKGAFTPVNRPRHAYAFDLAPSLPLTTRGNKDCLVVIDLCSLYTRLYPLSNRQAPALIEAFKSLMMSDGTTITYLRSDGELSAHSDAFQQFCLEYSIKHEKTAKASPYSNGVAETAIRNLKDSLTYLARIMPTDWDENLHLVCLSHAKVVAAHGTTPEKLHFGAEVPTPFSLLTFPSDSAATAIEEFRQALHERRIAAKDRIADRQKKRVEYRHKFEPGQQVLVLQSKSERKQPFACRYTGPYYITAMQQGASTCTVKAINSPHERKVQVIHLKHVPTAGRATLQETTPILPDSTISP